MLLLLLLAEAGAGLQAQTGAAPAAPPAAPAPAAAKSAAPGQAEVVLGRTAFPVNDYFTISFRLRGAALERYSPFPDIEGFKKSSKSSTTTTRIVGGQTSTELTITQRYAAYAEGEFELKPFTMTVNGLTIRSAGGKLQVLPQQATPPPAPGGAAVQGLGLLDKLFGKPKPQEFVEPQDNAFLALVPDKTSVFVGEGVHVGLYFYLTPADQGLLSFYNFGGQLPEILQLMRQRTAWEEPFNEQEIVPETVVTGGKTYLRYRLYEAEYYPLNTQPLTFPEIPLQMVKYRVAKKPEAGLDNRMEGFKTYRTTARTISVKPLPPHPLRDQVPVGDYHLREAINRTSFRTGQAFTYSFIVEGEGNLAALAAPVPQPVAGVEVYGPDTETGITRQAGRVGGTKRFQYRLIARRPGVLALDSLLSLVFFNPSTARYDTLRPEVRPAVKGPASTTLAFTAHPDDPYYQDMLESADNRVQRRDAYAEVLRYANYILLALGALALFGWWRGGRRA
ncbi:BatD family protein [Hymenobacter aquaticus]|uniref:BatD family protein n=1 Tax=Hymenobacter aquaticus TaxID=1867101 RepID=UPI0014369B9A|nr:BatD family protein [Hymenobacter aquaticus]